ncbi:MAG TPA: DsrE family protein [Casimicrobiaceae bacterium]|nr:DsrE family protein [Casimicrobiaceae bacterium]
MRTRLALLLWMAGPDAPQLCATPFFHAAAAAAMDVEVEIHFASRSVLLLVDGVAAKLYAGGDETMSVYEHMQQAARHGARFYACSDALAASGIHRTALIPEATGVAGAVAFVERALDPQWSTLVF